MTQLGRLYHYLSKLPGGKRLFSFAVCRRVPYFGSIHPVISEMRSGRAVVTLKQRRSLENHIGTVHAIAVCNLCEMAMGMNAEATIPDHLRWLPKGMNVEYLSKARGELTATCDFTAEQFQVGEVTLPVEVRDAQGDLVTRADIYLHITEKPS